MSSSFDRQRAERLAIAIREKKLRDERKRQASLGGPGYSGGLMDFIRYFWHVLEPSTKLVDGWVMRAICMHLEAVTRGEIKRLLINVPPGFAKSLVVNCFWPAWEWSAAGKPHLRYVTFAYAAHLTERDNARFRDVIQSPAFREMWGHKVNLVEDGKVKPSNDAKGWKFSSSIRGVGTGERGNRILADDVHNVKEGESEAIRGETVRWVREGMSNRLNDMVEDVIIGIGQRVHEEDASSAMLEDRDYVHLMIPMEFDPARRCRTSIGWEDPRTEYGELAWPARFPPNVVAKLKTTLGPYAYCTPHESPVLMGDLSLKPIGDVQVGETVIGFTIDNAPRSPDVKFSRRRLVRSTVVSVSRSVRKVVRMTLDSGRVIRCTPDHKWYTGRTEAHHPTYMPAVVGRPLMRICDPEIPRLSEDDIRAAGWLAGFFDGEGSAVMSQKGKNYEPSCLISFTQGYGQNEPLCHKLESVLTQLGFEYGFQERPQPAGHVVRWYYLTKGSWALPVHQRFVHVVQPTKWRDRIIDGALGTRFILGEEKVVSIEDDGEEEVFGLETTTGNYVVWGLASSNSSQYQQAPEPRGGGILKRDWWDAYELPIGAPFRHPFEFIVASLDPAFTAKQENDPSGFTCWGVYNDNGRVRIVLLHAWQKWLELHGQTMERLPGEKNTEYVRRTSDKWGLVEWVAHDCRRLKVNALLIEAKASGHSVAQEIRRLYADNTWGVRLINPGVLDKRARAYAVQHLFADGIIQAPAAPSGDVLVYREWAQMVIDEAAKFRGLAGEEDNLVDSLTQALKFLRDNGLATRDEERMADERERVTAGTGDRPTPLYDV